MNTAEEILTNLEDNLELEQDEAAGLQAKYKRATDQSTKPARSTCKSFHKYMNACHRRDQYASELRLCNERIDLLEHIIEEAKRIIESDEEKKDENR